MRRCSSPNVTEETTYFIPRNPLVDAGTNTDPPVVCCPLLRRFCPCPPRGLLASLVTKGRRWNVLGSASYSSLTLYCPRQFFWRRSFLEWCGPSRRKNVSRGATSLASQFSSSVRSSVASWCLSSVCPAFHRSHLSWVKLLHLLFISNHSHIDHSHELPLGTLSIA